MKLVILCLAIAVCSAEEVIEATVAPAVVETAAPSLLAETAPVIEATAAPTFVNDDALPAATAAPETALPAETPALETAPPAATAAPETALPAATPAPETAPPAETASVVETTALPPAPAEFVESNDTVWTVLKAEFDCRRAGHDCDAVGGNCDIDTGYCLCNDDYTGYLCNYKVESVVNITQCNGETGCGEDTEAVCVATGEGENTTNVCKCPYSLYGDACELPRIELRCSDTFMIVKAAPYVVSSPVYLIDHATSTKIEDKDCAFDVDDALRLPYDKVVKCGGIQPDANTNEIRFVLQSDGSWLTAFDLVITARCSLQIGTEYAKTIIVDASMSTAAGVDSLIPGTLVSHDLINVGASEITAERSRVSVVTHPAAPIITLGKEELAGDEVFIAPINGSVKIGDIVVFTIENVNDTFYSAIRAEECNIKMDEAMTAALIKDVCPASRFAWTLLLWPKTVMTSMTASYYLRLPANALAGQPRQITINCKVKLCAEDLVGECALPEDGCKAATNQFFTHSRKRRQADNKPSTKYTYVQKTFDIDYSEEETPRRKMTAQSDSSAATLQMSFAALIVAKLLF